MSQMTRTTGRLTILVVAALAALPLLARTQYQTQFRRLYKPDKRSEVFKASCMVCHEDRRGGGQKLNPYGEDLRKASRRISRQYKSGALEPKGKWDAERGGLGLYQYKAYQAVEELDSNGYEIEKDKLPGQNWSVAPKPKAEKDILEQIKKEEQQKAKPKKGKKGGQDEAPPPEDEPPNEGGEGGEG
jgi:cytochrome c2